MIQPKNETEDLLLSITKSCETLIKQLIGKQKKHWNLNLPNQEKLFSSIHQYRTKDFG